MKKNFFEKLWCFRTSMFVFIIIMIFIALFYFLRDDSEEFKNVVYSYSKVYSDILNENIKDSNMQVVAEGVIDIDGKNNKIRTLISYLKKGSKVVALDVQAKKILEIGLAKYWYPQYTVSPIIAIDRDLSDVEISSWKDLANCNEKISLSKYPFLDKIVWTSISYILSCEENPNNPMKDKHKALEQIIKKSSEKDLFSIYDEDAPVHLIFDFEALDLINSGKNIEIIIPSEGTIDFDLGVLSNTPIQFKGDLENNIFESVKANDMREALEKLKSPHHKIKIRESEYNDFLLLALDSRRSYKRNVLRERLYSGVNIVEVFYISLVIIFFTIIFLEFFSYSFLVGSNRMAAIFLCVLMALWVATRFIKYYSYENATVWRYLWYMYYLYYAYILICFLYMSYNSEIEKSKNKINHISEGLNNDNVERVVKPNKSFKYFVVANTVLFLSCLTNDFHYLFFKPTQGLEFILWEYEYGPAFIIFGFIAILETVIACKNFFLRGYRNKSLKSLALSISPIAILIVYTILNCFRVPFFRDSDFTGVFVSLSLLSILIFTYTGIIPTNTKHSDLFMAFDTGMGIVNNDGDIVYNSQNFVSLPYDVLKNLMSEESSAYRLKSDILTKSKKIKNGYIIWNETLNEVNKLNEKLSETVERISDTNKLLEIVEKSKKKEIDIIYNLSILNSMEAEIGIKIDEMKAIFEDSNSMEDEFLSNKTSARVALLACFIKRRCSLFFLHMESRIISLNDLIVYISELSEFSSFAGVNIFASEGLEAIISIDNGIALYEFIYYLLNWAVINNKTGIIISYEKSGSNIYVKFLLSNSYKDCPILIQERYLSEFSDYDFKGLGDALSFVIKLEARSTRNV